MEKQGKPFASALDAIGDTPLVELSRITRGLDGRILAKLEYLNPGLSKKDRVALQIVEDAEADGLLAPGQTVVELTSGNTGTGLAIVCAVKGYPFVAVMSKGNSTERARMMSALGAEVVLVDQLPGSKSGQVSGGDLERVEEVTQRIVAERRAFRADQFRLPGSFRAHYLHTGPEILRQAGGHIDAFCDFVGTGGSFAGCAAAFKEHDPSIKCYVVEPEGAAVLAGEPSVRPNHRIQGGGYSMPSLPLLRREHVDGYLQVDDAEAIETARRLAREEGVFAGFSSGANVAAALRLLGMSQRGKTIAVLLCDSGLKYLSTELWT
ncbi:MAG: cysteine synthase family protein [Candidatus Bipolaricaulota bacterium]|nr:cysteine synthase family protein [Candidatus Bipolaricaulota bacterium]